jgi:hypothetical protein
VIEIATEEGKEGTSLESPRPAANPESAQRARSLPFPSPAALAPVAERVRTVADFAVRTGVKAAELTDRPASLIHAQPPTFVEARVRHHERARSHRWAVARTLHFVYGYLHMVLIKPALNFLEWVTETPSRLAAAVAIIVIIYFWS